MRMPLKMQMDVEAGNRAIKDGSNKGRRPRRCSRSFLQTLPSRDDQHKIAHSNAEALYRLQPHSETGDQATPQLQPQS